MESTIKYFSRSKHGHGYFQALIANHASEVKHRSILKKRFHLLKNIKWNDQACPLESHAPNHRQHHDDLMNHSTRMQCSVYGSGQRAEFLLDCTNCIEITLQTATGLIRANTSKMLEDFEHKSSSLTGVNHFYQSSLRSCYNSEISSLGV